MDEIIRYDISKCVECKEYDKEFIEATEGKHFRVEIKPYLCPPCFVTYTKVYYERTILGKTGGLDGTVGSDISDWIGWDV